MPKSRTWVYLIAVAVALAFSYAAIDLTFRSGSLSGSDNASLASTSSDVGTLSIVTLTDGRLASGAVYRISPDPFTGGGNYTIHDGDVGRDSSKVDGIITIEGMSDGTFSVIQVVGPEGQDKDILPRIVTIGNSSSESVTFGADSSGTLGDDAHGSGLDEIESVMYASRFECGTIEGSEGPLRPGHYDTDIGIFNKQGFPLRITWTAASSNSEAVNALLLTLGSQTSANIVCDDILKIIGADNRFVEGFVVIEVPVDPRLRSSISGPSSVLLSSSQEGLDILDVQTFYTANALDELPHTVLVDKISFVIRSNTTTENLPASMIGKVLDITLPATLGEISDPDQKIGSFLVQKYNLSAEEVSDLVIEIISVDVGVGTMIDDHAISLSKVRPQIKYS